jgi:hypothetical protein
MMGFSLLYLQVVGVKTVSATLPFALMFGVSFGCLVPMRGAVGNIMFGTRAIGKVLGLLQGGPVAAGVIGPLVMGMIFSLLCVLRGREKKSKFAGFILPIGRVIFFSRRKTTRYLRLCRSGLTLATW